MPRTCIFCDSSLTGVRAEEHVIPRWLMEYLGVTDDQLYLAVAQSKDDTILKDRTHVAGNFVEGQHQMRLKQAGDEWQLIDWPDENEAPVNKQRASAYLNDLKSDPGFPRESSNNNYPNK